MLKLKIWAWLHHVVVGVTSSTLVVIMGAMNKLVYNRQLAIVKENFVLLDDSVFRHHVLEVFANPFFFGYIAYPLKYCPSKY